MDNICNIISTMAAGYGQLLYFRRLYSYTFGYCSSSSYNTSHSRKKTTLISEEHIVLTDERWTIYGREL